MSIITCTMKQTTRILTFLFVLLLLQPGCTTVRTRPEANEDTITARDLVKTTQSWDGASLPAYPPGQPEVTIRRIRIPAGARLETHRHPVINAGVLISGQLTVMTTDGKTRHLNAGDPIVELVNTLHYGINPGQDPADIIVFYAGTEGAPITVTEP